MLRLIAGGNANSTHAAMIGVKRGIIDYQWAVSEITGPPSGGCGFSRVSFGCCKMRLKPHVPSRSKQSG